MPPEDADAFAEHVDDTDRGVPTNAIGSSTSLQLLMEFVQPLMGSVTEFATGALAFVAAPDFEAPTDAGGDNVYDVTSGPPTAGGTDTQAIAVTVTTVNETPRRSPRNGGGRRHGQRRRERHGGDHGDRQRPGCRRDADLFDRRRGGRGHVQHRRRDRSADFITAPDFEAPTDAGGDNVYDVTVQASDGTLTDTQAIAVTVTDVNDNAPVDHLDGGGATAASERGREHDGRHHGHGHGRRSGATLTYSISAGRTRPCSRSTPRPER